ncbi:MAG: family 20 glycosylhydrolase [Chloroflexota bacterium]
MPRELVLTSSPIPLSQQGTISISVNTLLFEAQIAQNTLKQYAGLNWLIVVGSRPEGLILALDSTISHPQGYTITVQTGQITIVGENAAGVYYGVATLGQLLQHFGAALPDLTLHDWPDFPVRGVMLDVSRDKVMTMETLFALVELLASWKMNHLQLYMEHAFAYSQHETVWKEASPFTGQQILELDHFCQQHHIELVANQNSFGHMERWLKHPAYKHLAECPDGFIGDFGDHLGERRPATSLNPLDPASIALIEGLYNELLPHFTSPTLNVGGDEPWEMGQCQSRAVCETRGRGRVYVDYLLKLYELTQKYGRQMMFWADVIVKYPELIPEIPKDVIAIEWGYYMGHPYEQHAPLFAQSGLPFYVCPGTSSWNSLAGRTTNAIGNIRDAASTGLKYGASGLLITDWGDRGHWQPLAVSYLGFATGLANAWAYSANTDIDLPAALDRFAFHDATGSLGQVAADLGNLYTLPGLEYPNGSLLFFLLQQNDRDLFTLIRNLDQNVVLDKRFGIISETMQQALTMLDENLQHIARSQASDLVKNEFTQVAHLMRHACLRGSLLNGETDVTADYLLNDLENLIPQQRLNWLARNRPGGLKDSIKRFEPLLRQYRDLTGDVPSYL